MDVDLDDLANATSILAANATQNLSDFAEAQSMLLLMMQRGHSTLRPYVIAWSAYLLLHAFVCLAPVRRRVVACLGSSCLPFCGNDEISSHTTIGCLLGSDDAPSALVHARGRFRAIPAAVVVSTDALRKRHDGSQLAFAKFARRLPLGECDAFISHAWCDPPERRLSALIRWHATFQHTHGRPALVWLDQFCIDAASKQADLACIGAFIAGCRQFVLLASPSFATRLWCVLELVTFLEMGATISDVFVVPVWDPTLSAPEVCPLRSWIEQKRESMPGALAHADVEMAVTSEAATPRPTPLPPTAPQPDAPHAELSSGLTRPSTHEGIDEGAEAPVERMPSPDEWRAAACAALEPLTRFDVQASACHCPNDFYALLACIESAFGSHHCFNRKVRNIANALLKRAMAVDNDMLTHQSAYNFRHELSALRR